MLLVEDHDDSRAALRELLGARGYDVEEAATAAEGLAAARACMPDVAVIDIVLPDGDGCDVARAISSIAARRPYLIALTGLGQRVDRERAAAAGFDAFLLKPGHVDTLEGAIEAGLNRRAASMAAVASAPRQLQALHEVALWRRQVSTRAS